jgi:excisionase family DNA binding protein
VGEDRTDRPGPYQQRLTVRDAAKVLGISEGAVRMRIKRGTLPSAREGGRLYVSLNIDPTTDPERPHTRDNDRTSELIATLREQLEAERQAHAEARRIIAGLVERLPSP